MRVTQRMMADQSIKHMEDTLSQLNAAQEKVATGKNFQRASDQPAAAGQALNLHTSQNAVRAFLETAHFSDSWLSTTEAAYKSMGEVAAQAIETALSGLSDTVATARPTMADEIDSLLHQAIDIGNTNLNNSYVFSGHKTQTKPFELTPGAGGAPDTVAYHGDSGVMHNALGPDLSVRMNVPGDAAFGPLFTALIATRDALAADDTSALATALANLQSAANKVFSGRGENGSRMKQVEQITTRLENTDLLISNLLNQKEDVNMAEAIASLRHQETTYQTAVEISSRTLAVTNLFELLR